jgi:hypothetical protein
MKKQGGCRFRRLLPNKVESSDCITYKEESEHRNRNVQTYWSVENVAKQERIVQGIAHQVEELGRESETRVGAA